MKRLLLSAFAIASIGMFSANAQLNITITQADFAQASNTTIVMMVDTMPNVTIGGSGINQTWDFTDLMPLMIDSNNFDLPQTTGLDAEFVNANIKWNNSQLSTFLNSTPGAIEIEGILGQQMVMLGFPIDLGAETAFPFDNPMTMVEFPSTINSTFNDTSTSMFTTEGSFIPQVTIDSVRLKHYSFMESVFDAEGVVTNPGDTAYEAIRQYRVEERIDSIEVYITDAITALFLGVPMNTWSYFQYAGLDNPVLDTMYTYSWYANDQEFPVVNIEVDENDNPIRATWTYTNNLMAMIESVSNSACPAAANGTASVNIVGGTSPFTYEWDNAETTMNAEGLTSGAHSLTISDNMSESFVVSVNIEANPDWNVAITTTPMTCESCNDGMVNVSGAGGTSPYTYAWSNGATTESLSGLSGGTDVSLTVTDVYGCSATASTYISGIKNQSTIEVSIFPNPVVNGILNVTTNEPIEISIYNMIGELVLVDKVLTNQTIQLDELTAGLYLVQLKSDKGTTTRKITVK